MSIEFRQNQEALQTVRDLQDAKALLQTSYCWTQGTAAKNRLGIPVTQDSIWAFSFCILGALARVTNDKTRYNATKAAMRKALGTDNCDDIIAFNDRLTTEHSQVLALFDQAIALKSQEIFSVPEAVL